MIKNVLLLPLLLFLFPSISSGQVLHCGQIQAEQQLTRQHPDYQRAVKTTFNQAKQHYFQNAQARSNEVYQVPVVVHVVYNTPEQNISDEIIHSQIEVLNEDFRRLNADAENARAIFQDIGADAGIEFVLAEEDPDGNPTTGITRTPTEVESFVDINLDILALLDAAQECGFDAADPLNLSDSAMICLQEKILIGALEENADNPDAVQMDDVKKSLRGGKDPWNPKRYINIWVTNLNFDFMGQSVPSLLGFAYPPVGAPNWPDEVFLEDLEEVDGVVVHFEAFGRDNPNPGILGDMADGGRTCTHEMGHYFGLRHVHGDGGCGEDDGISDTPSADANQQAQADPNNIPACEELHSIDTCPEDGLPDMVENYMDYNAITCQNLFTIEQVGIMRAMLEGPRAELIMGSAATTNTVEILADHTLQVYPNPAQGSVFVKMPTNELGDFTVSLQNTIGQEVIAPQPLNSEELNLQHITNGIYFLIVKGDGWQIARKIMVNNTF